MHTYVRVGLILAAVGLSTFFASGNVAQGESRPSHGNLLSADLQILDPTFSDEFSNPTLDPKFFFDNPGPNPGGQSFSLTENPGFLRLTTTGRTDLWGGTNTSPKILESGPTGDFQIISRVLASPDVLAEHAGIIVMEDSTHWVRLIRDSNQDSVFLQQGPGSYVSYVPFSGGDVILSLTKTGSSYEGAFSTSGNDFTQVGTTVNALTPTHIGMTIASTPPDNVFSADFDYFRVFTGLEPGPPVGGIAELPEVSDSSGRNYIPLAGLAAAALVALGAGAWYAGRRLG